MGKDKIQLLAQALHAASSSINLAKQLLGEIERGGGTREVPGLVGKYDGMFMITEAGKKYPVPDNYAAKTKLVYGDKLKMIEGPEGRRFKLLEEVERAEAEAQLVIKDGHFEALGKEGSYKVIQGAVRHWNGAEGDRVKILIPKGDKNVPFACLVEVVGKSPGGGESPQAEKSPPKPEEIKPVPPVPAKEEKKATPADRQEEKSRPVKKEAPKKEEIPAKKPVTKPLDEEDLR